MAIRIVGVDLPQNKRGEIALTYIYGIGRSSSAKILDKAGVNRDLKVSEWSDDQAAKITLKFSAIGRRTQQLPFRLLLTGSLLLKSGKKRLNMLMSLRSICRIPFLKSVRQHLKIAAVYSVSICRIA